MERGFGAADQAIEVFENLVVGAVRAVCSRKCVSNGVLLERQNKAIIIIIIISEQL